MLLFTITLVLPLMLLFAGLAIDLAALGALKGQAQVAADAGATAGASAITWTKDDPACVRNCPGAWTVNLDVARAYCALDGVPCPAGVTFDPAVPKVTITLSTAVPTSFLRLLGIATLSTGAVAAAARTNITQLDKDTATPGRSRLVR